MPRGQLTKNEMKVHLLDLKRKLHNEKVEYSTKELANEYLNFLLDKIEEYAR